MIRKVRIRNFKSIKDLEFKPAKINVFIGEPNTGKSNILEAIGLFSLLYDHDRPGAFVRFRHWSNLFYDDNIEDEVNVTVDEKTLKLSGEERGCSITIQDDKTTFFDAHYNDPSVTVKDEIFEHEGFLPITIATLSSADKLPKIKFYRFKPFSHRSTPQKWAFLKPPNGENIVDIIKTHKSLLMLITDIFGQYGYNLLLKPYSNDLEIVKTFGNAFIALPYKLVSDTLQRQVFFMLAIKSNKDSVLLFEEPEAHAFPRHIKTLAETIAMDKTNQFFIATHNPYLLRSIMEKAPKGSLNIYATYMKDYQTRLKLLDRKTMEEIFVKDLDPFFNLEKFLEG